MKRNRAKHVAAIVAALCALLVLWGPTRAQDVEKKEAAEAPAGAAPAQGAAAEKLEITDGINTFTVDYLKHLARTSTGNEIASPQGIFHGLAMSYVASGGETRKELAAALHFPDGDEKLIAELATLRGQFMAAAKHKRIEMNVANGAWLDSTYATFKKDYVERLKKAFDAALHSVEFKERAKVCKEINAWAARHTNNRITNVIAPKDIESKSRPGWIIEPGLVTVNAIYFKADWASQFDKKATRDRPFHLDPKKTEDVPMMHQESVFPYAENDDFKFLEMAYIDGHFSMYVLLPKKIISVKDLMAGVDGDVIKKLRWDAAPHEVDVLFPKFEVRSHASVKDALAEMGAKTAFDWKKANFDRMIIKKFEAYRIYLSEVYHDAWIEVNEEGTEAAAATTTVHYSIGCSAPPPLPPKAEFHADRPFLFLIVHNASRSALFGGWITNPKTKPAPSP